MGKFLTKNFSYKAELTRSMEWLAKKKNTIFLGQAVGYSGHALSGTLINVPSNKKFELPVFEETQMGIATGMALSGFVPINIYPRFDFFILSLNQFINHLDKIHEMSYGRFKTKVFTRVAVGTKIPFSAGPQHTQNHIKALQSMTTHTKIINLY